MLWPGMNIIVFWRSGRNVFCPERILCDTGPELDIISLRSIKIWYQNGIRGIQPSALIFHEWNKNCFLFISIINNRIQFQWKIIRGMKRGSFLQKSTLCLIIIWRKLDTVETNYIIFFYFTLKLKATGLENNLMVIHFQIQAENILKRCI